MAKKKVAVQDEYHCRDCVYATDFHEKNMNGGYFMCKCKFHRWSRFLNLSYCEHFKLK